MAKFILTIEDGVNKGFTNYKEANIKGVRNTLNTMAALTRKNAIKNVKNNFTLRNTYTTKNIIFKKADKTIIAGMESQAGALKRAKYMKLQEEGGQRPNVDGRTAIGQKNARKGNSSRQVVSRNYYIKRIAPRIVRGPFKKKFKSSKAKMVASMHVAHKKKLFLKRGGNIYRVSSVFSSGGHTKAKLDHLYHITTKQIFIDREPWLLPATKKPVRDGPNIYKSSMKKLWKDGTIN